MRKRKPSEERVLKHDEKVLWNLVTRTVSPMKTRVVNSNSDMSFANYMADMPSTSQKPVPLSKAGLRAAKSASHAAQKINAAPPSTAKQTTSPQPIASHIDKPVYRKIAKGRLPIDSQIDLHDMTQDQAIQRLERFLNQARNMGHRHVLVITGKGGSPTSEGVLRRMLPMWLNGPEFSSIVNGYQAASRSHGGDGAFYVRLRRQR